MKKIIIIVTIAFCNVMFAQFREQVDNQPTIHDGLVRNTVPSLVLGFINPNNFSMKHTVDLSYSAFGNQGMALGVYTNSMLYKFTDNLNISADVSLVNSPYNSFGKDFANQINGIYLTKAELNYKPWENVTMSVQYRSYPFGSYGFSRYNRGYFYDNWLGW
jgi:hypothetical protein